jgi:cytochrome c556
MRSLAMVFCLGAMLLAAAANAQAPAPVTFHPIGNMSQLMIDIIYPTSDALFYVDRDTPKTQRDWNTLRTQALTLAESGNLLMMEGRARDQENWIKDSQVMADIGAKAYKAAQAKDLDGIRALNDSLSDACIQCHLQYRPGYHRRPPAAK